MLYLCVYRRNCREGHFDLIPILRCWWFDIRSPGTVSCVLSRNMMIVVGWNMHNTKDTLSVLVESKSPRAGVFSSYVFCWWPRYLLMASFDRLCEFLLTKRPTGVAEFVENETGLFISCSGVHIGLCCCMFLVLNWIHTLGCLYCTLHDYCTPHCISWSRKYIRVLVIRS